MPFQSEKQQDNRQALLSRLRASESGNLNGDRGRKLSLPSNLPTNVLAHYQKYQGSEERELFRERIECILGEGFSLFQKYANYLRNDGILLLKDFVNEETFANLLHQYEKTMRHASQNSSINYSFIDLEDDEDFVTNQKFKDAFLHPLLIALISYEFGGPVRVYDARAEDAGPTRSVVRDNGVHMDDSLYGRTYRIILLWQKGQTCGPKGQNFVTIPRSHRAVRSIPTEHGSNFKTPGEIIDQILLHPDLQSDPPFVMEAEDQRPLTIVFEGSGIAHHRFRTTETPFVRSSVNLAFHVDDKFNHPGVLASVESASCDLDRFVIGGEMADEDPDTKANYFLQLLEKNKHEILQKLRELEQRCCLIKAEDKKLSKEKMIHWLVTIGETPNTEDTKPRLNSWFPDPQALTAKLLEICESDIHIDLDLQLYPDRHELVRHPARKSIREMGIDQIMRRSDTLLRFSKLHQPCIEDLLNVPTLLSLITRLSELIDGLVESLEPPVKTGKLLSLSQLLVDLGEALGRCESLQGFRTTSLFLYWTFDEVYELLGRSSPPPSLQEEIHEMAQSLLQHYVALVWFDDKNYQQGKPALHRMREEIEEKLSGLS